MIYGFDESKHKVEVPETKVIDVEDTPGSTQAVGVSIPYPTGFTKNNTIILGIGKLLDGGEDWCWGVDRDYPNEKPTIILRQNNMVFEYNPSVAAVDYTFKVVVARLG